MQSILNKNKWYFFIGINIIVITLNIISKQYLYKSLFFYEIYGEQLSKGQIDQLILRSNKYMIIGYLLTPIILLIKVILITVCLKIGLIFINIKISWGKILNWIIKLETIFLIPLLMTLLWFLLINIDYTYAELQFFYPLSLLNLFNSGELDQLFVYPLRLVNVFELLYWLALAKLFATETGKKFGKAFEFVMYTYGVGLLIWVVFVMFLTVNIS